MKTSILALAATTMLAVPALAQSQDGSQRMQGSGSEAQQTQQSGTAKPGDGTRNAAKGACARFMETMHSGDMQGKPQTTEAELRGIDEVTRTLEENGLRSIEVENASYFVMANAPGSECVLMLVDTSTMPGAMARSDRMAGDPGDDRKQARMDRQAEAQERKSASSEGLVGQLEEAGYSDIRVLNATYAVNAELGSGQPVTMMIRSGGGDGREASATDGRGSGSGTMTQ